MELREALGRMEKHREVEKWRLVLKEGQEVARVIKLPGNKGQQIWQKIEEFRQEAEKQQLEVLEKLP